MKRTDGHAVKGRRVSNPGSTIPMPLAKEPVLKLLKRGSATRSFQTIVRPCTKASRKTNNDP